jgi:hypothetical protein
LQDRTTILDNRYNSLRSNAPTIYVRQRKAIPLLRGAIWPLVQGEIWLWEGFKVYLLTNDEEKPYRRNAMTGEASAAERMIGEELTKTDTSTTRSLHLPDHVRPIPSSSPTA